MVAGAAERRAAHNDLTPAYQSFSQGAYMKKLLVLGLVLGGLFSQGASAAIRTFNFSATIEGSLVYNDTYPNESAPGMVEGTTVAVGDRIEGRFSFDDAVDIDWSSYETQRFSALSFSLTFVKDGTTFDAPAPQWMIFGSPGADTRVLGVGTLGDPQENPFAYVNFDIYPSDSGWDYSASRPRFTLAWSRPGASVIAFPSVTSLRQVGVSPVPEPSTWAMLLLGAAVAAGAANRRSAHKAG